MASDVLVDLTSSIKSHLSTDSLSSDDDAVNTESARVYFGPLKSPEKKYAIQGDGRGFTTPVRRSTRLSPAPTIASSAIRREMLSDLSKVDEETETGSNDVGNQIETSEPSREDTPLVDEPSSALANRILRAHDNPSPPPTSPSDEVDDTRPPSFRVSEGILIDVSENPDNYGDGDLYNTAPGTSGIMSSSYLSHTPIPAQTNYVHLEGSALQHNLIDFDSSCVTLSPCPRPLFSETHIRDVPKNEAQVLDLLSFSPVVSSPNGRAAHTQSQDTPLSAASVDEEAQVLLALTDDANSSAVRLSPSTESISLPQVQLEIVVETEATTHTPLRRSTRPRRTPSPMRPLTTEVSTTGASIHNATDLSKTRSPRVSLSPPKYIKRSRKKSVSAATNPVIEAAELPLPHDTKPSPQSTLQSSATHEHGEDKALVEGVLPASGLSPISENAPAPLTLSVTSQNRVERSAYEDPVASSSSVSIPDSPRTPARRVPISEAIQSGVISTHELSSLVSMSMKGKQKASGSGSGILGSPFKRLALDDPARSPAKRVPMSEATPLPRASPMKGQALTRKVRSIRAMSEDQESRAPLDARRKILTKKRSASEEPAQSSLVLNGRLGRSFAQSSSTLGAKPLGNTARVIDPSKSRNPLPFPIVPAHTALPSSIPEADESDHELHLPPARPVPLSRPVHSSPAKTRSSLRQPSTGVSSRIPRIGAKPYSRPNPAVVTPDSRLPANFNVRRAAGSSASVGASNTAVRPLRIVNITSSGSSSDESAPQAARPANQKGIPNSLANTQRPAALPPNGTKRKREGEHSQSPPPPITIMRKVVTGMFNNQGVARAPHDGDPRPSVLQAREQSSPAKPRGPIKMRRVQDWIKPPDDRSVVPETPVQNLQTPEDAQPSDQSAAKSDEAVSVVHHTIPSPPVPSPASESALPAPDPDAQIQDASPRRVTRSRKSASGENASNASGSTVATKAKSSQPRRKHALPKDSNVFFGMTALALKTLTTTNTSKNQKQVAELRTEVVRKEGKRPASPTTRVRTVLEQQKEANDQQRRERAQRRAQRLGVDVDAVDADTSSDFGDRSMVISDYGADGSPLKHRRGPGDEEDYVTPDRPARPSKKGRMDDELELELTEEARRVRWHRGLATTVFLDGSPPKPRRPRGDTAKKGCLAPTAKSLRLDTLGNVLNAEVPLVDLVRENIVVKKFVYDDDVEPEPPEPQPAPAAKSSKGKGRKSK